MAKRTQLRAAPSGDSQGTAWPRGHQDDHALRHANREAKMSGLRHLGGSGDQTVTLPSKMGKSA